MNTSTCRNGAPPGHWTCPFQPPVHARRAGRASGAGPADRGVGGHPPAVRLPADLGPPGPRGLVGQQEGRAADLALSGLRLAGPRATPKPRRPHGQDANACHLRPSRGKDDVWTWDFIFDRTSDGRSLKWLSLVDEYTRECLALEARRGMTAEEIRVILAEVATRRGGPPHRVRSDNGPEFAAEVVRSWLEGTGSGAVRRAGQPVAERLRGVVPQQVARRVPGPRGVRERAPSPGVGPGLEGGVQYRTSAQFLGLQDTGRVRGPMQEVRAYRKDLDRASIR